MVGNFLTAIYARIVIITPLVITFDNYRNLWKVLPEWNFDDEWQRQQDKYFGRETLRDDVCKRYSVQIYGTDVSWKRNINNVRDFFQVIVKKLSTIARHSFS